MTHGYLLGWILQCIAAGLLLAVVFRATRGWRPVALRLVLRTIAAVWLFMPAVVDPEVQDPWMAPAIMVLAFEWWDSFAAASRVLEPMLAITAVAIALVLAAHWGWLRWQARRAGGGH